jgi:hypothetical protein
MPSRLVFWLGTPRGMVVRYRRFGGTYIAFLFNPDNGDVPAHVVATQRTNIEFFTAVRTF